MLNIVVCVSGGGTNLQAIIDGVESGTIRNTNIAGVISNNAGAYALERAQNAGIPAFCVSPKDFSNRREFNEAFLKKLEELNPDLIGKFFITYYDRLKLIYPEKFKNVENKNEEARFLNTESSASGFQVNSKK